MEGFTAMMGTVNAPARLYAGHQAGAKQEQSMTDETFDEFMARRHGVAEAFVRGDPDPLRSISAGHDPVTFFGPSGGVEQGAGHVVKVNEEGAKQFGPGGSTRLEILHQGCGGGIGYWTGLQHATVFHGSGPESTKMTLRVTEVFRREGGRWKLVHRHADSLRQEARER
jgi:ketosteroid isomerase-like protein